MHEEESGVNKISFQNAAEAEYTVYPESFTKENIHRFCESWCISKHFLVLFQNNT